MKWWPISAAIECVCLFVHGKCHLLGFSLAAAACCFRKFYSSPKHSPKLPLSHFPFPMSGLIDELYNPNCRSHGWSRLCVCQSVFDVRCCGMPLEQDLFMLPSLHAHLSPPRDDSFHFFLSLSTQRRPLYMTRRGRQMMINERECCCRRMLLAWLAHFLSRCSGRVRLFLYKIVCVCLRRLLSSSLLSV